MLKIYLLNKWALSGIALLLGMLFWTVGWTTFACVFTPLVIAFILSRETCKRQDALGLAFTIGAMVGVAGLMWLYALIAGILLTAYIFGPMKVNSTRMFLSLLYGIIAPFWVALPIYFYLHFNDMSALLEIVESTLQNFFYG